MRTAVSYDSMARAPGAGFQVRLYVKRHDGARTALGAVDKAGARTEVSRICDGFVRIRVKTRVGCSRAGRGVVRKKARLLKQAGRGIECGVMKMGVGSGAGEQGGELVEGGGPAFVVAVAAFG